MLQAGGDLMDSTRYTNQWEADKHERQLKDGNEAEACEDACYRKPKKKRKALEKRNC